MGREQPAEFYDQRLTEMVNPLETNHWTGLYEKVADLLPSPSDAGPIADLGCGTGRFAELLRRRGYSAYWGVDFSTARIEEARRYVPGSTFEVGDVFDPAVMARFAYYTTFVITEVLEHVERDLELLRAVPAGAFVVLSVPSYDSDAHVRHFGSRKEVINRYGGLIDASPARLVTVRIERGVRAILRRRQIYVLAGRRT